MDFFASQEQARRRSALLVVYYIAAVILIIAGVYLALVAGLHIAFNSGGSPEAEPRPMQLWRPVVFLWSVLGTLAIVATGTFYKISQLGGGGAAVAELLGGRRIPRNTSDPGEQKLLNVVDEMAIASGTAAPEVFVLGEEAGINAFAAGFSPSDAVIAVTRGTLEQLDRDELQGVVAHEFSHIINGDMRLNIRLTGVLHGILLIALTGYFLFRTAAFSGGRSRRDGRAAIAFLALGLTLMVIGFVGIFFGKLIKSAVSRQREFLADASAVQYTRNPGGIAGALKKIGGFAQGAQVSSSHAEEASHFFFANALRSTFLGLLSTHPPLDERIGRLEPSYEGEYGPREAGVAEESEYASGFAGASAAAQAGRLPVSGAGVVSSVGAPRPSHIAYAVSLLDEMPAGLRKALRDTAGARAVLYSLLLSQEPEIRNKQVAYLEDNAEQTVMDQVGSMKADLKTLGREFALPVVDVAVSSLKELSSAQFFTFKDNISYLVRADEKMDLFEFTLTRIVDGHLAPRFMKRPRRGGNINRIKPLIQDAAALISCLAHWGTDDPEQAEAAFERAFAVMDAGGSASISAPGDCGLAVVERSLSRLDAASPSIKKKVLESAVACVAVDGFVTCNEAELLRAIADSLGCPVPPIYAETGGRAE
jgi:Zn-dependent protease with chaperone function